MYNNLGSTTYPEGKKVKELPKGLSHLYGGVSLSTSKGIVTTKIISSLESIKNRIAHALMKGAHTPFPKIEDKYPRISIELTKIMEDYSPQVDGLYRNNDVLSVKMKKISDFLTQNTAKIITTNVDMGPLEIIFMKDDIVQKHISVSFDLDELTKLGVLG